MVARQVRRLHSGYRVTLRGETIKSSSNPYGDASTQAIVSKVKTLAQNAKERQRRLFARPDASVFWPLLLDVARFVLSRPTWRRPWRDQSFSALPLSLGS